MDELQSLFSQTPSLRHLKIVSRSFDMINGSRWEQLIKSQLPALKKLQFYTSLSRCLSENEMILPFRAPFWTEEKRWLVICNVFPTRGEAEMYTLPICISHYTQVPDQKMKTISNFEREDQHSTVLETVNELSVDLCLIVVDDRVSTHPSLQYISLE
jgi:hypothetical protein